MLSMIKHKWHANKGIGMNENCIYFSIKYVANNQNIKLENLNSEKALGGYCAESF